MSFYFFLGMTMDYLPYGKGNKTYYSKWSNPTLHVIRVLSSQKKCKENKNKNSSRNNNKISNRSVSHPFSLSRKQDKTRNCSFFGTIDVHWCQSESYPKRFWGKKQIWINVNKCTKPELVTFHGLAFSI